MATQNNAAEPSTLHSLQCKVNFFTRQWSLKYHINSKWTKNSILEPVFDTSLKQTLKIIILEESHFVNLCLKLRLVSTPHLKLGNCTKTLVTCYLVAVVVDVVVNVLAWISTAIQMLLTQEISGTIEVHPVAAESMRGPQFWHQYFWK